VQAQQQFDEDDGYDDINEDQQEPQQ